MVKFFDVQKDVIYRPPSGSNDFGRYWQITLHCTQCVRVSTSALLLLQSATQLYIVIVAIPNRTMLRPYDSSMHVRFCEFIIVSLAGESYIRYLLGKCCNTRGYSHIVANYLQQCSVWQNMVLILFLLCSPYKITTENWHRVMRSLI